jgi:dihydroorotase-like cyclic amidohydrolase
MPDRRDLANESFFEYGSRAGVWRLHIHHLSTRRGLERVVAAKQRGVRITCEALAAGSW